MSDQRSHKFRRNELLEGLLTALGNDLWPSEEKLLSYYQDKTITHPFIFVMGPLRSGTTLFTQWLANTGVVAYPTNLLSRFYQAPIVGAKIQLLLTDPRYNFRDELGEFLSEVGYLSENGKTKGVLAPNEFWYFWRRFLADPARDVWSDEELYETMDVQSMKCELTGIVDVFQKPFAAKGMLFNYNISFLDSILERALFIQIRRDQVANVASVLEARKRQLGSDLSWYSFKIPEYDKLKKLEPVVQAAGQIHYINRAVTAGMSQVAEKRKLIVQYEDFCADPKRVFKQLCDQLELDDITYHGPESFEVTREGSIKERSKIEAALAMFTEN